ncbi:MAG TPA: hypothetical protein VJ302_31115 [Blastocatellia bacterium]|nr:hypothetical protein [Blastocatellia bacterium]
MLKRIAALSILLLIAGQASADGIVCGLDLISDAISEASEMSCPMKGSGDCDKMPCCKRGKSPIGAATSMICCEVKCGESTGGAQFNFTPLTLALAPPIIGIRFISLGVSDDAESGSVGSRKSAENSLLHYDPPDLYLQNSAFLI